MKRFRFVYVSFSLTNKTPLLLYKVLRNQTSLLIQDAKKATYKSKIESGKDDPKSVWKILKSSKSAVIMIFWVSK